MKTYDHLSSVRKKSSYCNYLASSCSTGDDGVGKNHTIISAFCKHIKLCGHINSATINPTISEKNPKRKIKRELEVSIEIWTYQTLCAVYIHRHVLFSSLVIYRFIHDIVHVLNTRFSHILLNICVAGEFLLSSVYLYLNTHKL